MAESAAVTPWRGAQAHGRRANRRSYHDGIKVNGYVDDPYHRARRAVAARMGADGVAGRLPVLELGCGPRGTGPDLREAHRFAVDAARAAGKLLRAGARGELHARVKSVSATWSPTWTWPPSG